MELDEAYALARAQLDQHPGEEQQRRFTITRAERRRAAWAFFYSSAEFVRTLDSLHAMGGDSYLVVFPNGAVLETREDLGALIGPPLHPGDVPRAG